MPPKEIFFVSLTIFLLSVGQVLFKYAAERIDLQKGIIFGVILNPALLMALLVYGVATMAWLFVLRILPLKTAYPLIALAFVIVPVMAHFFFGETLRWNNLLGASVIIIGVYISIAR